MRTIENKQQQPKSIASFCRVFLDSKAKAAHSRKPEMAAGQNERLACRPNAEL
jgi:hypothetical protein